MQESLEQRDIAFQSYYEAMHEEEYLLQDEMLNPIAFLAGSNEDTMYFHQAMKAPDRNQFKKAIVKEVNDHIENKHWELIPHEAVPKGVKVLPSVWSMKRKRDIKTQQVYKHKARLNVHGGKQVYGKNYFETYAPVVTWFQFDSSWSSPSSTIGTPVKLILSWHTPKQTSSSTCIWNCLWELKQNTAMEKHMCSNFSRTSTVKNRLDEYGTNILSRD
jgi:hypothetical protein